MSPEARERSFDALATEMASGTLSRGRALKLMGAALVGGALASLGIGEADARKIHCKPDGKHCKSNGQCCNGICDSVTHRCTCLPLGQPCGPDTVGNCCAPLVCHRDFQICTQPPE